MKRLCVGAAIVVVGLLLFPDVLHAWTPGTHIYLGETVLANLQQLPGPVVDLLRAYPFDYLYGNIAADTSIAKKYAPVGRHCHAWHVGQEIYDLADNDRLRAFGLGYLSHLAADVIAHNFYVPRQLVVTSSTTALGHSYWESRFETHLGESYARTAREVILMDHAESDEHLDRTISPTIFSVGTSRRLFRGMVRLIDTTSWQRAFQIVAEKSRWDLADDVVERHMGYAFDAVMAALTDWDARIRQYDPAGQVPLREATRMRRARGQSRRDPERLAATADEHFGLPDDQLEFWPESEGDRPWEVSPRDGTGASS